MCRQAYPGPMRDVMAPCKLALYPCRIYDRDFEMKPWATLPVLIALYATAPQAAPITSAAEDLYRNCKEALKVSESSTIPPGTNMLRVGLCLGLIEGVKNTIAVLQTGLPAGKAQVCWKESGMSNIQGAKIIIKYLDDHPNQLSENQTAVTMYAFKEAFPCK